MRPTLIRALTFWTALSAVAAVKAGPVTVEHRTRAEKIEELAGDLGYGGDIKHTDAAVPYLAAQVAPGDSTWNEKHSHWRAVSALIGRDLRDDAQAAFAETEGAIVENATHALSDGVVTEDLDAALAFFRSAIGHRFLALQDALIDLSIEVGLEHDSGAGVTVENFDARRRVLQLWLPIVFVRALYGPETADRTLEVSFQKYSRLRGPQLDALAQRYGEDLPLFEQFIGSSSLRRIITAAKEARNGPPPADLSAFFAAEARRHALEWQAAVRGP